MKRRSILSVIPAAIFFGILIGGLTYFVNDMLGLNNYRAQSKLLTTSKENIEDDSNLALTFAATVDSDTIKNKVISNLGLDWTPSDLDRVLTIAPVANTPVINFIIEDPIKLRAEDLADEYADVSAAVLNDLYQANTEVLEYSYQNAGIKSNKEKNAIIFGAIAFLVWFVFAALFTAIRNFRIKEEYKEIENKEVVYDKPETKKNKEFVRDSKDKKILDTNKYQVISDIPEYKDGDLDV